MQRTRASDKDNFDFSVKKRNRSKEEIILLMLCALSIPSILPFGLIRLFQANWTLAIVDLTIVSGMIAIFLFVWRTGRVQRASLIVTIFYSIGMLAAVFIKGASIVYWVYPTMIAAYFMLKASHALLINTFSLSAIVWILNRQMNLLDLSSVVVTLVLINLFSYIFSYRTNLQHHELNLQAEHDFLTGAGNRRALDRALEAFSDDEMEKPLESCLLLLDLDHFKKVNDQFGHAVGDQVLKKLCDLIRTRLRATDGVFRYGGEEFVIIAVGTDISTASVLAEELRAKVESSPLCADCPVTVSIGVAKITPSETASSWFQRADAMLYEAKQGGRNTVRVAT
ncbi:GGDEF domain-containing protein [Undibacterium sp. Jales W-56]|uniref:GGDEF domain-containing protein n=1 Tax=Undibacterium sp. Jales W-56 TaxID=2897325 RepID=UPI0021CF5D16|nr:GGDEF domain-containing protein [Undibacterium sp. Jales W-56]MCU6432800.1 GGDEF domain-containing protein [Undibacterium sp. Jales W-56]